MKKYLIIAIISVIGLLSFADASAAVLQGFQGGTGRSTSTAGQDGNCLIQVSSTPLTYAIQACPGGSASGTFTNVYGTTPIVVSTGTASATVACPTCYTTANPLNFTTLQAVLNSLSAQGLATYNSSTGVFTVSSSTLNLGTASQYNKSDVLSSSTVYVSTFNTRSGAVTLSSGDVTTALGFTPIPNITGLVTPGTNITITGSGTSGSPYVVNTTGGTVATTTPFTVGNLVVVSSSGALSTISSSTYYLATNPNNYISSSTGSTLYYPLSGNPSGFVTSSGITSINNGTTPAYNIFPGTNITISTTTSGTTINSSGGGSTTTSINGALGPLFNFIASSTGNVLSLSTSTIGGSSTVQFLLNLSSYLQAALTSLNGATSTSQTITGGTGINVSTTPTAGNSTTTITNTGVTSFNTQAGVATYVVSCASGCTVATSTTSTAITVTGGGGGSVNFRANGTTYVTTSTIGFTAGSGVTITTSTDGTYTISAASSSGALFEEDAAGTVNGSNTVFTTANVPVFMSVSGQTMTNGDGYTLSGTTETFSNAPYQTPHSFYSGAGSSSSIPVGSIEAYVSSTAPSGWLLANGQTVATTTYSALFSLIGYTYGGSTSTFGVPNMGGRFIAGPSSTLSTTLGAIGGNTTSTFTPSVSGSPAGGNNQVNNVGSGSSVPLVSVSGATTTASIIPPYIIEQYIIKF